MDMKNFNDDFLNPDDEPQADVHEQKKPIDLRKIIRKALKIIDLEFPKESDCREEIYRRYYQTTKPTCIKCGEQNFERARGSLSGKCLSCKKVQSLMKETPFYKMKKPRAILSLIILLQEGYEFNSKQFAVERGIAESSSWEMRCKVNLAILVRLECQDNIALVNSADFEPVIARRSKVTPANEHPIAEEKAMKNACSPEVKDAVADVFKNTQADTDATASRPNLAGLQKSLYETLSDTPLSFENLMQRLGVPSHELASALTMLELEGLVIRLPGDRYIRARNEAAHRQKPQNEQQNKPPAAGRTSLTIVDTNDFEELIQSGLDFIRDIFHGVSRKYIQLYVADFWRVSAYKAGKIPFSIFDVCCEAVCTSTLQVKAFNSPLKVKMIPLSAQ